MQGEYLHERFREAFAAAEALGRNPYDEAAHQQFREALRNYRREEHWEMLCSFEGAESLPECRIYDC